MENTNTQFDVLAYMRSLTPTEKRDNTPLTLREWNERWLTIYCKRIKQTTKEAYICYVNRHINRVLGDLLLGDIQREDIQLFVNSLALGVGLKKPLSSKTIKNVHGILHKSLDVAVENGYLSANPAKKNDLPKITKPNIHAFSIEEIKKFLMAVKGSDKEKLFKLTLFTGLRAGEVIGLTWDCINFEEGYISVYRQLVRVKGKNGKYFYKFSSLKSGRARRLYPATYVLNMLYKMKDDKKSEFVFCNSENTHFTHSSLHCSLKKIADKMGITDFRFHDLRHTYATLSIRSDIDTMTLKENMGHFSAAFTLDVYGHCDKQMKIAGSEKMDKFISDNFNHYIW